MKKVLFTLKLLVLSSVLSAQQSEEPVQKEPTVPVTEKFPRIRPLSLDYNQSLSRSFDSELFDEEFGEGDIKSQKNFNALANVLIKRTKNWILLSNANYKYTEFKFENVKNTSPIIFERNGTVDYHYFAAGLTSINISTLFKKRVIYNSSLFIDGDNNGIEQLKASFGFSLYLKRTKETTIGVGLQGFIDHAAPLPVLPVLTFKHKLNDSDWEIDLAAPRYFYFRRLVGEDGRLSLGSTFGTTLLYATTDAPAFNDVFNFTQLAINPGILYENKINEYFIISLSGGLQSYLNNRFTKKTRNTSNYIYKNTQNATGYFQVGISIDPRGKNK